MARLNVKGRDVDKANDIYKKWYENNRDDFNRLRREKYKKNAELRKKMQANAKRYRKEGPKNELGRQLYREFNGKKVEVFRISEVAILIERSPQTIRMWEKNGYIPEPMFEGIKRVYTIKQIELIKRVAQVMAKYRYNTHELAPALEKLLEIVYSKWEV